MTQSLSKIFIHIVYHVSISSVKIRDEDNNNLYAYIGAIIKNNDSIPILINGMEDHIHILCVLSKKMSLAKLVEEIKRNSSRWIKKLHPHYKNFSWQRGYGGFSVSPLAHKSVKKYIENQKEHHKKMNFDEEYLMILKVSGIPYNE